MGNKVLTIFVIVLFVIVILITSTKGFWALFLFPILFISVYAAYYLYQQMQKADDAQLQKGLKYATEEIAADTWLHDTFAPKTLQYLKTKRWMTIVYSFVFVILVSFFWSYLNYGLLLAIRNLIYACILFWLAVVYILSMPIVLDELLKFVPFQGKKYIFTDWGQAYIFFLPISFFIYVLFPYETLVTQLLPKLRNFPIFFLIYSFSFLCLYCIVYLYEQTKEDDQKHLEENLKKMLHEN